MTPATLIDTFGRQHRDLRLSLTDKCNLRCTYCMPEDFAAWTPQAKLLTRHELVRVVRTAVDLGITSVRLTGGEPLLHPEVVEIVRDIAQLPNAPAISLTSNGLLLAQLAKPLREAGLQRINISLDTLDARRFAQITKRDRLAEVLAGIAAAEEAGIRPIKINTVLMRGVNESEAGDLLRFAIASGWSLRFIEQMPLDAGGVWSRATMVTAEETLAALKSEFELTPHGVRGSAPAEEFLVDSGPATVGIIASVTKPFCGNCDRLRVTADGQVRNCLFARSESDLRGILRDAKLTEDQRTSAIAEVLGLSVRAKLQGHGIGDPLFLQPIRPMSAIGG
ncbi:MAG: GTP 3',8-cyclase MoaA [Actinomycetota bacterium]|nr:GTP 3',8-cyclase MoaA [Actinomycetota bacterium]